MTMQYKKAFVATMISTGNRSAHVCVAVAWGAVLRGNEVLALSSSDVAFAGSAQLS